MKDELTFKHYIIILVGMAGIFTIACKFYNESVLYSMAAACGIIIFLRIRRLIMLIDDTYKLIEKYKSLLFQCVISAVYICLVFVCAFQYSHENLLITILITAGYLSIEIWALYKIYKRKKRKTEPFPVK